MENQLYHDYPQMDYIDKLSGVRTPTGFPFVELLASYQASQSSGRRPFLPYDLHPSEHGIELAAAAICGVIQDQSLLESGAVKGSPSDN